MPFVDTHRLETVGVTAEDDVRPRVDEAVAQGDVDITRLGVELDSPVDDYDDEVGIVLGGLPDLTMES